MKASFWLDIFYLLLLFSLPLCAAKKGLIRALFARLRFILPLLIAFIYSGELERRALLNFSSPWIRKALSFFAVFFCAFAILVLLESLLAVIFENSFFSPLNLLLGFAFGLLEALIIALFITALLSRQQFFDLSFMTEESFFFQKFLSFLPFIPHLPLIIRG